MQDNTNHTRVYKRVQLLQEISAYRSELMGWAIVWIMMLHFNFTRLKPLGFVAQYGFAGVDIFMFVSGFGLFFSLDKDGNPLHFYKKRVVRIFPTYYILGLFSSLIHYHDNIPTYLCRHTTIGYWLGGTYADWYIPALIFLYLIAPLVKNILDKKCFFAIALLSLVILLVSYYFIDKENILDRSHFFLLYRIPAFFLGMLCACWKKNKISSKYFLMTLLLGIPMFIILYPHHHVLYQFKYFSTLFLMPLFVCAIIAVSKFVRFFNPISSALGKASLEIYLIHMFFFHYTINQYIPDSAWHDTITIAMIVTSSLLGILAHWLIGKSSTICSLGRR